MLRERRTSVWGMMALLLAVSFVPNAVASVAGRAVCPAPQNDLGAGRDGPATHGGAWYIGTDPTDSEPRWGCVDTVDTIDILAFDIETSNRDLTVDVTTEENRSVRASLHASDGTEVDVATIDGETLRLTTTGTTLSGRKVTVHLRIEHISGSGNYSAQARTVPSPPPTCPSNHDDAGTGHDIGIGSTTSTDLGMDPEGIWRGCIDMDDEDGDALRFKTSVDHYTTVQVSVGGSTRLEIEMIDGIGNRIDQNIIVGSPGSIVQTGVVSGESAVEFYLVISSQAIDYGEDSTRWAVQLITIGPPTDLEIDSLQSEVSGPFHRTISIDLGVRNIANAIAPSSIAGVYLSTDTTLTTLVDHRIGSTIVPRLTQYDSTLVSFDLQIPNDLEGWFYVIVRLNDDGGLDEITTSNNLMVTTNPEYAGPVNGPCSGGQTDAGSAGDAGGGTASARDLGTDPSYSQPPLSCVDTSDTVDVYMMRLTSGTRLIVNVTTLRDLRVHTTLLNHDGLVIMSTEDEEVLKVTGTGAAGTVTTLYVKVEQHLGAGEYILGLDSRAPHTCTGSTTDNDPGQSSDTSAWAGNNPTKMMPQCLDLNDRGDAWGFDVSKGTTVTVEVVIEESDTEFDISLRDDIGNEDEERSIGGIARLQASSAEARRVWIIVTLVDAGSDFTLKITTQVPDANRPDFVVESVAAPPMIQVGSTAIISWTVLNQGADWPYALDTTIYFSIDSNVDDDDITLLEHHFQGEVIENGTTVGLSGQFDVPILTEGTYHLIVAVDEENEILESEETNNHRVRITELSNTLSDKDEDGVLNENDACPEERGNSIVDRRGCPDADGDGWSDEGDDFPDEESQWIDRDGDGWGDNESGLQPDMCPDVPALNLSSTDGCPAVGDTTQKVNSTTPANTEVAASTSDANNLISIQSIVGLGAIAAAICIAALAVFLVRTRGDPDNLFPSFEEEEEEEEEVESDSPDIMLPNEFGEMER